MRFLCLTNLDLRSLFSGKILLIFVVLLSRHQKIKLNFSLFISQDSKRNLGIPKLDNNTVEFSNIIPNFISRTALCFNTKLSSLFP